MLKNVFQILHTLLKHSALHGVTASESPQFHTCRVVKLQGFSKLSLCKQAHRTCHQCWSSCPAATLLTLPTCAGSKAAKMCSMILVPDRSTRGCCASVWGKAGIIPVGTRNRTRVAAAQTGCNSGCPVGPSHVLLGPELPGSWTGWQSCPSPQELLLSAVSLEK